MGFGHELLALTGGNGVFASSAALVCMCRFEHSSNQEINQIMHTSFDLVQLNRTSSVSSGACISNHISSVGTPENLAISPTY